jgi:hypothetical protein
MSQSLLVFFIFFLSLCVMNLLKSPVLSYSQTTEPEACSSKAVVGHTEQVFLGQESYLQYQAKIDSGADTSSLHATHLKFTPEPDGQFPGWIEFDVSDDQLIRKRLKRKVSRISRVKSSSGITERYFVWDVLWVENKMYALEFNLADRSALSKKMILGKNFLSLGYVVDTTVSFRLPASVPSSVSSTVLTKQTPDPPSK